MKGLLSFLLLLLLTGPYVLCAQRQAQPPGAPTASGEPVTIGTVFQLSSKHVNETRTVRVYVPPSHDDSPARYPVLYVLDGEAYFLHAVSTARALAGLGLMPEAIVVAIHNTHRRRDMTPPSITLPDVPAGGADAFLAFLEEELIPFIEGRYRTLPLRILIGHSHGGLLNTYALVARPQLFRWHLAMDPPVHLNNQDMEKRVAAFLTDNPDHAGRLVTVWSGFSWSEERWHSLVEHAPPAFYLAGIDLPDETHESMYFVGMYDGLKKLFHDFAYDDDRVQTLNELEATYSTRAAAYGYAVPIPQRALLDYAEEHLLVGQPDQARPLLDRAVALYGASARTERLQVWLEELLANPLEETTESLLSSPQARPEDLTSFRGVWEGHMPGPVPVEITFAVEQGAVVGQTVQTLPNGQKGVFEHVMTRVLEDGTLEWGYMNKMRPRSLLLAYRATLEDEKTLRVVHKQTISMPPGMSFEGRDTPFLLKRKSP